MAATDVVSSLQREVERAKEGLKSVDENIKKLTGRDPSEARGPVGNRRIVVKRNFGERIGGPPQKRFNTGNAYSRLGPRGNERNNRRLGQLESDGEEEEDDAKKPTLQSSIVATPAPSRQQQDEKTDKKTQTRNKRMFGVLLGTLQKFKENSSKEAARERKRKQIEKKLEEAAVKEREEAIRQKKELFFARKEQQTKLQELERKMAVAEMLEEWEDHDRKLSKFIRTNTKPHIFYLPAKHNDYTLGLLEKTSEHVEDEIKKRRQEIQEILRKPEGGNDAHGNDERELGDESVAHGDNLEHDVKQEVEHSDDEGNTGRKVVKVKRREVILSGVVKDKRGEIDDEIGDTNEVEEGELGKEDVKSAKREERDANVEASAVNEGEMESEGRKVGEKADTNVETEEMPEEKERDGNVEMSEVNEERTKSVEKEVEEKKVEGEEVEAEKMPEENEQGTTEEVTGDTGVNRNPKDEPKHDGDNSEVAVTREETAPPTSGEAEGDRSMDMVVDLADIPPPKHEPKEDGGESKMNVDPGQDNVE